MHAYSLTRSAFSFYTPNQQPSKTPTDLPTNVTSSPSKKPTVAPVTPNPTPKPTAVNPKENDTDGTGHKNDSEHDAGPAAGVGMESENDEKDSLLA